MITKTLTKAGNEQPDEEGVVRFIASTEAPDSMGDTIDQAGWSFRDHTPLLFGHDHSIPALGKIVRRTVEQRRLLLDAQFDLDDEFAAKIYRKYDDGVMQQGSVGFDPEDAEPNDHGGIHFKKQTLLEFSVVNVGAHPDAMEASAERKSLEEQLLGGPELDRVAGQAAEIARAVESCRKDGRTLRADIYDSIADARDTLDDVLAEEDRGGSEGDGNEDDEKAAGDGADSVLTLSDDTAGDGNTTSALTLATE